MMVKEMADSRTDKRANTSIPMIEKCAEIKIMK